MRGMTARNEAAYPRSSRFSRGRLSAVSRELRGPRVLLHLFTRQFTMDLTGLARWPLVISRRVFSGKSETRRAATSHYRH